MNVLNKLKSVRVQSFALSLVLSFLLVSLYIWHPLMITLLEGRVYDALVRESHTTEVSPVPLVIDLDEDSLKEYGQWPWPRYRLAMLLGRLGSAGVASVGLDIVISEPDRTSPIHFKSALKKELNVDVQISNIPKQLMDNDSVLAGVLSQTHSVLGFPWRFSQAQEGEAAYLKPVSVSVISTQGAMLPEEALMTPKWAVNPLHSLVDAASGTGFYNALTDADGVIRRVPLLTYYNGQYYGSLALTTLLQALPNKNLLLKMSPAGTKSLRVAGITIPLDGRGNLVLKYKGGRQAFQYISAGEVLAGKYAPGSLKGRIAFIGTSAVGLSDLRTTPFGADYPGVEVHATVVDNILSSTFVVSPDYEPGLQVVLIVLLGLLLMVLLSYSRPAYMIVPVAAGCFGLWYGSGWLFSEHGLYISPVYGIVSLGTNTVGGILLRFWHEIRSKAAIRKAFSHYLAPAVMEQVLEDPEQLQLGGQDRNVSILFSDIRSFTSLSEKLEPGQVATLLCDYLTPMTHIVRNRQGTLDKFIGDAVMAFWNAPLDVPNHQTQAVHAALEMFEKLAIINERFTEEYGAPIKIGVGVHCGNVRVGNMGSADLFDYTLIGDAVNLASRLEGLTKYYGQDVIVSEDVRAACPDEFHFLMVDKVQAKGKKEPVTIFGVYSHAAAEERKDEFDTFEKGFLAYQNADFVVAIEIFKGLLDRYADSVLYNMYYERCIQMEAHPPESGWNGVFAHMSK
ncbi:MAG: CHASE2 domain-containing protein [Desulfovibrio sp.]